MKKYSKNKLKLKRGMIFAVSLILFITLIIGIVIGYASLKNNVDIYKEVNDATAATDDMSQNSTPIIIDNLVVGATYNNRWVSSSKYYLKSKYKTDTEMCAYTKSGKAGTFKIKQVESVNNAVYASTTYINYLDEYLAISSENSSYSLGSYSKEEEILEQDYNDVKRALGFLKIYNSSIRINSVYNGYINASIPVRIICITSSEKGNFGGVYSAVIIVPLDGNPKIVAYSYTKDLDNSDSFPIYSFEFLADLNGDGNCEVILREITEFNVTYSVFEYRNGVFYRILAETIKGK